MYPQFNCVILIMTCMVYATSTQDEKCLPVEVPLSKTTGMIAQSMGLNGWCSNKEGIKGFKTCRGFCKSGYVLKDAGQLEPRCNCCRVTRYALVSVILDCDDGSQATDYVASHEECACKSCDDTSYPKVPAKNVTVNPVKEIPY